MFNFSASWTISPPISNRISEEDMNTKSKGIKHPITSTKSTLECHQSRKIRNKSDSVDLEMDDPLQSPTLTTSIAYLEERDLIPPTSPTLPITEREFENIYYYFNC